MCGCCLWRPLAEEGASAVEDVSENSQSGTNWEEKGSRLLKYRNWIFRIGGGGSGDTAGQPGCK